MAYEVELFIEGQKVVLSKDIAADITYSIADIRTPDKRQVNYSKTLTIEGTVHNDFIFGNIYDIDVENEANDPALPNVGINYTPKKLAKSKMFSGGVQIFDGTLRLWKIVLKDGRRLYEVSLFGKLFDLFGTIGDAKLSDLDFSDLNHAVTWDNIRLTWEDAFAGAFRYPYIDFGTVKLGNVSTLPDTMIMGSLAPCIYYKIYIDKIFTAINASYVLGFSDTTILDKMLLTPSKGGVFGHPTYFEGAGIDDGIFYEYKTLNPTQTFSPITVINREVLDVIGVYNPGTDKRKITFPINMETSIQFFLKFGAASHSSGTGNMTINVLRNRGGSIDNIGSYSFRPANYPTSGTAVNPYQIYIEVPRTDFLTTDFVYLSLDLVAGQTYRPYAGSTIKLTSPIDTSEYPLVSGGIYDMNKAVPEGIKQVDFIKDFIKLFNLMVTQDKDDPSIFTFTPQIDFYKNIKADAIDWTNKVDHNEEIEFTPLSQLTAKEYILTWKADKDYWNEQYTLANQEVYGQVTYIADTDVVSNKEKVDFLFSPCVMQKFTGSNILCPAIYKVELIAGIPHKKIDKFNSRIIIWGGLQDAGHNIDLLEIDNSVNDTVTQYPYAGHINNPINPTFDINFGNTNSTLPTSTVNQFSKYWGSIIRDSVDKDGKLVSCTMLLRPEDIEALDFSALYKIGFQYFRLNKISSYNPFTLDTSKVEFIKVVRFGIAQTQPVTKIIEFKNGNATGTGSMTDLGLLSPINAGDGRIMFVTTGVPIEVIITGEGSLSTAGNIRLQKFNVTTLVSTEIFTGSITFDDFDGWDRILFSTKDTAPTSW